MDAFVFGHGVLEQDTWTSIVFQFQLPLNIGKSTPLLRLCVCVCLFFAANLSVLVFESISQEEYFCQHKL